MTAESRDGNMRVTYVIYEVEVPRLLKYDNLKAELLEVDFHEGHRDRGRRVLLLCEGLRWL